MSVAIVGGMAVGTLPDHGATGTRGPCRIDRARGTWRRLAVVAALSAALACSRDTAPPVAAQEGPVNTLKWTAATEQGVYGYIVYRSAEREGPFLRQNERIVRVPADGAATHGYEWVDRSVEPGRTYYYYLDVVSEAGVKQRFSGIIARTTASLSGPS